VLLVEAHKCTQPEVPKVRAISQAPLILPGSTYPSISLMSTDTSLHLRALCRLYLTRQKYRSGGAAPEDVTLLGQPKGECQAPLVGTDAPDHPPAENRLTRALPESILDLGGNQCGHP